MRVRWYRHLGIAWVYFLGACGGADVIIHKKINESAFPLAVAIVPFTVASEVEDQVLPAKILRRAFLAHFSYLGYSDLPLAEVDRRLKKSGYDDPENFASMEIAELRKLLGADAVVKGHILNANNFTGGIYAETWIHAKLEMIDLRTGVPIWETDHQEIDQSSIISPTVISIIQQQMENTDKEHAYQKLAEEFALQVVREIPDPADLRRRDINLPAIESFKVHFSSDQTLHNGDSLAVILKGNPNMKASFDIGNWKTRLPMKEISSGIYRGEYQILATDQVTGALVIGRLADHFGLARKKVFQGAVINIQPLKPLH